MNRAGIFVAVIPAVNGWAKEKEDFEDSLSKRLIGSLLHRETFGPINFLATRHRQQRLDVFDLVHGAG